jgi:hypothetical protein
MKVRREHLNSVDDQHNINYVDIVLFSVTYISFYIIISSYNLEFVPLFFFQTKGSTITHVGLNCRYTAAHSLQYVYCITSTNISPLR